MKTIHISDEDYETLMELSKELQTQENDGQAFPYFWVPTSKKLEQDPNDNGSVTIILDTRNNEEFSPEEWAEYNPGRYKKFLEETHCDVEYDNCNLPYDVDFESDWVDYLRLNEADHDIVVYSSNWEWKEEVNPSLFKSDVKNFIASNAHHLGESPKTYAHSVWRMPKMEKLIKILYRLNHQPNETMNNETAFAASKGEK